MNYFVQELEKRLIEKMSEKLVEFADEIEMLGAWQTSSEDILARLEGSKPAQLSVAFSTPSQTTFSSPEFRLSVTVTLFVRYELDRENKLFPAICQNLGELFREYMSSTYQAEFTAFDTDEVSIDDFSVGGGAAPIIDRERCEVSVSWPITLSGTYK